MDIEPFRYREVARRFAAHFGNANDVSRLELEVWFEDQLKTMEEQVLGDAELALDDWECDGYCLEAVDLRVEVEELKARIDDLENGNG